MLDSIVLPKKVKQTAIGILAAVVVLVDSISFFWSMAGDLLLVAILLLLTKIPTKAL